ncbi:MAG: NAD-dependent epimerase/dehydratase family protein, partial [Nitrososphaerales archaeon]
MDKKILITGGAGYIGSVLTKVLLDEGYTVAVLDRFIYGQNSLLDCCGYDNFSAIRGDVRDKETLSKAMRDADFIIHLAALVGAPAC